jgi:hypothetical protein
LSSDQPPDKGIVETAADLGDQAYRQAYERVSASERASGAADLAKDIASLMLRTAITIAEDFVEAAGELESVVAGSPRDGATVEPHEPDDSAVTVPAPVALALPDVSPGDAASLPFDVRNDSLETVDGMRLRCAGLFGAGGIRISGPQIKFAPVTVDVAPHGTASVTCTVNVPASAKRGHYIGLIEATGLAGVQLLVTLDVV